MHLSGDQPALAVPQDIEDFRLKLTTCQRPLSCTHGQDRDAFIGITQPARGWDMARTSDVLSYLQSAPRFATANTYDLRS